MAVVDLSTLKDKAPTGVDYEDLSDEEKAQIDAMAEDNPEPVGEHVRTAFLVLVNNQGEALAVQDLSLPVIRDHLPSTDEIFAATALIQKDIQVQESAQVTASFMQQIAQMAQQQAMNARVAQGLNLKG